MILKCCLKKKISQIKDRESFSYIKEEIEKTNLASYDIRNNPNYAMIINEMDEYVGLRNANTIINNKKVARPLISSSEQKKRI